MYKFIVYVAATIIVAFAMESINLNAIFKKNKQEHAKVFYLIIAAILIYLLGSFIYDVLTLFI